jgi:hypothetical protein
MHPCALDGVVDHGPFISVKGFRIIALLAAIAATLGVLATTAAAGQASRERPAATEVGVTGSEIHIAVIADVDNPFVPNIFIGARYAVEGFARYINASCTTKNRCLAGRKLVVDFYDSKLNPNEARDAEIDACDNDVAMVGTSAAQLTSVDEMRSCKDQAGQVTGIPDIPFVSAAVVQQCSDQSFPITPPSLHCETKDQHPQTYDANVARGYYFTKRYGDLHGVYVFSNISDVRNSMLANGEGGLRDLGGPGRGIRSDGDSEVSPTTPQPGYTSIIQTIKNQDSDYAQCSLAFGCTVLLRREAVLQGVTRQVKVWDCETLCYDKGFLRVGRGAINNEYVDTLFLPFYDPREQKANPMLANFVRYTGNGKVDGVGVYAWAAAVAFRDAVNATVKVHGVNGLTRANLLAALSKIHKFDAGGMYAPMDLAGRKTSDCHVLMQVRKGTFVRVQPTKPGTFDCNPKYLITRKLDMVTSP